VFFTHLWRAKRSALDNERIFLGIFHCDNQYYEVVDECEVDNIDDVPKIMNALKLSFNENFS